MKTLAAQASPVPMLAETTTGTAPLRVDPIAHRVNDELNGELGGPSRDSAARQRLPIPIGPRGQRRRICDTGC